MHSHLKTNWIPNHLDLGWVETWKRWYYRWWCVLFFYTGFKHNGLWFLIEVEFLLAFPWRVNEPGIGSDWKVQKVQKEGQHCQVQRWRKSRRHKQPEGFVGFPNSEGKNDKGYRNVFKEKWNVEKLAYEEIEIFSKGQLWYEDRNMNRLHLG